jgi:hypothetical protein
VAPDPRSRPPSPETKQFEDGSELLGRGSQVEIPRDDKLFDSKRQVLSGQHRITDFVEQSVLAEKLIVV